MFDTLILLTGPEEQAILTGVLREHNPNLAVLAVATPEQLADIDGATLRRARLVAFTTMVIVPPAVLDGLGYGAYNFHPGPPEYPGWAPAHFALYDRATAFGVTAHVMVERVDEGAIVRVDRFEIPKSISVVGLEELAYARLARMFWGLAQPLATQTAPLAPLPIRWSRRKNTRRSYAAICDIPLDIAKDELDRRLEVFGDNHFGIAPTVRLHGIPFRLVRSDKA